LDLKANTVLTLSRIEQHMAYNNNSKKWIATAWLPIPALNLVIACRGYEQSPTLGDIQSALEEVFSHWKIPAPVLFTP
jgi:hypothetical protein